LWFSVPRPCPGGHLAGLWKSLARERERERERGRERGEGGEREREGGGER